LLFANLSLCAQNSVNTTYIKMDSVYTPYNDTVKFIPVNMNFLNNRNAYITLSSGISANGILSIALDQPISDRFFLGGGVGYGLLGDKLYLNSIYYLNNKSSGS
jgi:hypothetical protein